MCVWLSERVSEMACLSLSSARCCLSMFFYINVEWYKRQRCAHVFKSKRLKTMPSLEERVLKVKWNSCTSFLLVAATIVENVHSIVHFFSRSFVRVFCDVLSYFLSFVVAVVAILYCFFCVCTFLIVVVFFVRFCFHLTTHTHTHSQVAGKKF